MRTQVRSNNVETEARPGCRHIRKLNCMMRRLSVGSERHATAGGVWYPTMGTGTRANPDSVTFSAAQYDGQRVVVDRTVLVFQRDCLYNMFTIISFETAGHVCEKYRALAPETTSTSTRTCSLSVAKPARRAAAAIGLTGARQGTQWRSVTFMARCSMFRLRLREKLLHWLSSSCRLHCVSSGDETVTTLP